MKFAILAGGKGTRLSELTKTINKPLIPIGDIPLVLHVAVRFFLAGARTIEVLIGHEANRFRQDFEMTLESLRKINLLHPTIKSMLDQTEFNLIETDGNADTFQRIVPLLDGEPLMVTYGDTLTNVDVDQVILVWQKHDSTNALTCVTRPKQRFSSIKWDRNSSKAISFHEKKGYEPYFVGCGFIILPSIKCTDPLRNLASLEKDVLPEFVRKNQLLVHEHIGLWHPIDYLNDLEEAKLIFNNDTLAKIDWLED